MNKPSIKHYPPSMKLLILMLIIFSSSLIFGFLANTIALKVWGVNLGNISSDDTLGAGISRFLLAIQHLGFFVLPALLFSQLVSQNRISYLSISKWPPPIFISLGLILFISLYPLLEWITELNLQIPTSVLLIEMHEKNIATIEAILNDNRIGVLLLNLFVFAVLPAIGEELVFRGLFQKLIGSMANNVHVGVWVSALIFSLIHFQVFHFFPILLMGVLFGYLLAWSGSLFLPILLHFLNNLISVLVSYLSQNGNEQVKHLLEYDITKTATVAFSIAIVAVILFYLSKRSVWKTFRKTYLDFSHQDPHAL